MQRITVFAGFLLFAIQLLARAAEDLKPKMILQITVDQLRGDLPERYFSQMGNGGFRYWLENGVVHADAHHAQANTRSSLVTPPSQQEPIQRFMA